MARAPSELCESTTHISSAHATLSRQAATLRSSFFIGTMMEMGSLSVRVIFIEQSSHERARPLSLFRSKSKRKVLILIRSIRQLPRYAWQKQLWAERHTLF